MNSVDWTVVGQALGVSLGSGCIVAAAVYWLMGRHAPRSVSFPVDGEVTQEFDDKEMRRLMKQTSAEMEETGEWWSYRWSK